MPTLEDGMLSSLSWSTYSGQFTHNVVACRPQIGRRAEKARRPKIDILTTELRRQHGRHPSRVTTIQKCGVSLPYRAVASPRPVIPPHPGHQLRRLTGDASCISNQRSSPPPPAWMRPSLVRSAGLCLLRFAACDNWFMFPLFYRRRHRSTVVSVAAKLTDRKSAELKPNADNRSQNPPQPTLCSSWPPVEWPVNG